MNPQEAIVNLLGPDKNKKTVIFQSRFRNFRILLKLTKTDERDGDGNRITEQMKAVFKNGILAVADDEANAPLIKALRAQQGTDYREVDLQKQAREESEKDKKIAAMQKELDALKGSRVSDPTPRMKKSKASKID